MPAKAMAIITIMITNPIVIKPKRMSEQHNQEIDFHAQTF